MELILHFYFYYYSLYFIPYYHISSFIFLASVSLIMYSYDNYSSTHNTYIQHSSESAHHHSTHHYLPIDLLSNFSSISYPLIAYPQILENSIQLLYILNITTHSHIFLYSSYSSIQINLFYSI